MIDQHMKYGYLDYTYKGKREGNIGGEIVFNLVSRYRGIERCDAGSINRYDVVLISIPSTSQIIDIYRLAKKHKWNHRTCKIVAGGFEVQNVNLLCGYIDYAFFGRVHDVIDQLLIGLESGGIHDSIRDNMMQVDDPHNATFRQSPLLTERDDAGMVEQFTGCPLKCKFCHYTYSRKHNGIGDGYTQSLLTGGGSDEVLYKDILSFTSKRGRIRTAIDGFSERIRYAYGKRISNDMIVDAINHIGDVAVNDVQCDMFGGGELNNRTVMTVYNICNMPHETANDEREFIDAVSRANPRSRVIFILHSTPFRASPATPMQWELVNIFPDWSAAREKTVVDRDNLLVKYSYTLEGPWSQLMAMLVERSIPGDGMIDLALSHKKGRSSDMARSFVDAHDVSYYLGEHDIAGDPPGAWYLGSHIDIDTLRKMAIKMRKQTEAWTN